MFEFNWQGGWDFIAVILTIILGLFSLYTWRKSSKKKDMGWRLISDAPVLTIADVIKGRVKILLDDKPIQQAHYVVVEIVNIGGIPIRKDEFERPITVSFGKDARLLSIQCEGTPKEIEPTYQEQNSKLYLDPLLLNEKEMITVRALVERYESAKVEARIVGVSQISKLEPLTRNELGTQILSAMLAILAGIVGFGFIIMLGVWLGIPGIGGWQRTDPQVVLRVSMNIVVLGLLSMLIVGALSITYKAWRAVTNMR